MEILTAPIPTQKLLELFANPELSFTIDYPASLLKNEVFIDYSANSNVRCSLVGLDKMSYNERAELLNCWIDARMISEISTLKDALVSVFLGTPCEYFTAPEIEKFRSENAEILDDIAKFYNSMLIMIPSISVEFKEHLLNEDIKNGHIEELDGTDHITPNIYSLVFYPNFIDLFLGANEKQYPLAYYKGVIETYFYKDKSFFELMTEEATAPNLIAIFNYFFAENAEETKEE